MFEPMGGFPPIIRDTDAKISKKTLESRGFATTNIVSITNIMEKKKKKDSFIAFGSEDETGYGDLELNTVLFDKPNEYNKISFKDVSKKNK
jgi:hypothetical protein